MRGDIVVVQELGGNPLIRRVWDSNEDAVFVCSDERFHYLENGEDDRQPNGFPKEFVFEYDESTIGTLKSLWQIQPSVWASLSHWGDKEDVRQEKE